MRKTAPVVILVVGVAAIVYGLIQSSGDPVKNGLFEYVNEDLAEVRPLEQTAVEAYRSGWLVYQDNEKFYPILAGEIIPAYEAFHAELGTVRPARPETAELHTLFLHGVGRQVEGLRLLKDAMEKASPTDRNLAEGIIRAGSTEVETYRTRLVRFASEHGVRIE